MAETRTYNPSEGDDIARLVREALGENIRPVEPGSSLTWTDETSQDDSVSLVDLPDLSF